MKAPEDTSRVRKALAAVAAAGVFLVVVVGIARCSAPSTIQTGTVDSGTDATNAAAAGVGAVRAWAGTDAELVGLRWLDAATAVVTVRLVGGEHVAATAVRSGDKWQVPAPPAPAPAPAGGGWASLPAEKLAAAAGDARWEVAAGFLDAWLTGQPTERWTATDYTAPPPSVVYSGWEPVGVGGPFEVPGTAVEVVAVDFEAAAGGGDSRLYRAYVAVTADSTGRWTVNAVAHRRPPSLAGSATRAVSPSELVTTGAETAGPPPATNGSSGGRQRRRRVRPGPRASPA